MGFHASLIGNDLHGARAFTGTGSPVGVRTPGIVGELYFDTVAQATWIAYGLTNTSWVGITGSPTPTAPTAFVDFTPTPGQTVFTLPGPPAVPGMVYAILNIGYYHATDSFTLSGPTNQTFTWISSIVLDPSDKLRIYY